MKHLYKIDHNVTYWAIADTPQDAIIQCHNVELEAGNTETETLGESEVSLVSREDGEEIKFHLEGEEETCSMWFAYMLLRSVPTPSTVLACSEW